MGLQLGRTDEIGSVLLIALAAGVFVVTADFPQGPVQTGPEFYPRMVAALIAFFAAVQLVRALRREGTSVHQIERDEVRRVTVAFLLVVGYVLLLPWIGFVPGTVAFLATAMWYSGVRSVPRMAGVAVGLSLVLYYVFVQFLRVPLPEGVFLPVREFLPALPVVVVPARGVAALAVLGVIG